jgi:hypothetical protein
MLRWFIVGGKLKAGIIRTAALFDINYAVPCDYSWAVYFDAAGM